MKKISPIYYWALIILLSVITVQINAQTKSILDEAVPENFYVIPTGFATWDAIDGDDFQFYKIWLNNIFIANVDTNFFQYNEEELISGETYIAEVQALYNSGMSDKVNFEFVYLLCDSFPAHSFMDIIITDDNNMLFTWIEPEETTNEFTSLGTNIYWEEELIAFVPEPDTFYLLEGPIPPGFYDYCIAKVYTADEGDHIWTSCSDATCIQDAGYPEECYSPINLTAEKYLGDDFATLNWTNGNNSEWLYYDLGEPGWGAIPGLNEDYTFCSAIKFVPEDLSIYSPGYVQKIRVFKDAYVNDDLTVIKIFSGDGYTTIYEQDVTGLLLDGWNEIELNTAVSFDNTENLWIAIYAERQAGEGNTLNAQAIEIMSDRYDYFSFNGEDWTTISDSYGLFDQAWMLRAFVSTSVNGKAEILKQSTNQNNNKEFLGYNIYRNGVQINDEIITSTRYEDGPNNWSEGICYQVTEVRSQCESDPSNEACLIILQSDELSNTHLVAYPNPAQDFIMLESNSNIHSVLITNSLGQVVSPKKPLDLNKAYIETSSLSNGLYFVEVESDTGIEKLRVIISK